MDKSSIMKSEEHENLADFGTTTYCKCQYVVTRE